MNSRVADRMLAQPERKRTVGAWLNSFDKSPASIPSPGSISASISSSSSSSPSSVGKSSLVSCTVDDARASFLIEDDDPPISSRPVTFLSVTTATPFGWCENLAAGVFNVARGTSASFVWTKSVIVARPSCLSSFFL